jgi:hypothetical protein
MERWVDSDKLNDWMQIVGLFALVGSLIFIGLQMKQTQEIALSTAYQARVAAAMEMNMAIAANPSAMAAMRKPQTGGLEAVTEEEGWAGEALIRSVLLSFDNVHYQFEKGFLDRGAWDAARVDLKSFVGRVFARPYVETRLSTLRPSYRDELSEILEEIKSEEKE